MKLSLRRGGAWMRAAMGNVCSRVALVAAWPWGRPLARALLLCGVVVALAAIGRSTLAGAAARAPSVAVGEYPRAPGEDVADAGGSQPTAPPGPAPASAAAQA